MTKLLLIEDDISIAQNLTEYLSNEGFSVKNVLGQSDARIMLEQNAFDLVLLDISLSDGNGFAHRLHRNVYGCRHPVRYAKDIAQCIQRQLQRNNRCTKRRRSS